MIFAKWTTTWFCGMRGEDITFRHNVTSWDARDDVILSNVDGSSKRTTTRTLKCGGMMRPSDKVTPFEVYPQTGLAKVFEKEHSLGVGCRDVCRGVY